MVQNPLAFFNSGQLLITSSRTTFEQTTLLQSDRSRHIVDVVRDDLSSLLVLRDNDSSRRSQSILSESSSRLNKKFDFDREILSSKVYQMAIQSNMRQPLSRKRNKLATHQESLMGPEPSPSMSRGREHRPRRSASVSSLEYIGQTRRQERHQRSHSVSSLEYVDRTEHHDHRRRSRLVPLAEIRRQGSVESIKQQVTEQEFKRLPVAEREQHLSVQHRALNERIKYQATERDEVKRLKINERERERHRQLSEQQRLAFNERMKNQATEREEVIRSQIDQLERERQFFEQQRIYNFER